MSMGLYVVLALTNALSSDGINSAAKEMNIPLVVSSTDLSKQSGYLPMKISGKDSGVETFVYPAKELEGVTRLILMAQLFLNFAGEAILRRH